MVVVASVYSIRQPLAHHPFITPPRVTERRYTVRRRYEHLAERGVQVGRPLSRASYIHTSPPLSYCCVVANAPLMTEVNAQHPSAIDRHVRVAQWHHWCRNKCRSAYSHCFRIHICDISICIDAYSSVHVHITECRWAELVKAIKYCNEKAQYSL